MITVKQYYHIQYGSLLCIQWPGFEALAADDYKGMQFKGIKPYDAQDNGTFNCPKTGARFVVSPGCWIARKSDASALVMADKVFQRDCVEAEQGHIELEEPCTIDLGASDASKPIEVVPVVKEPVDDPDDALEHADGREGEGDDGLSDEQRDANKRAKADPDTGLPDGKEPAEGDPKVDSGGTQQEATVDDKATEGTSSPGGDSPASDEPAKQPS